MRNANNPEHTPQSVNERGDDTSGSAVMNANMSGDTSADTSAQFARQGLAGAHVLVSGLRALGMVRGPTRIADGALVRAGLADAYLTLDTPLGLIYVAWNPQGLSLAQRAESAEQFETQAMAALGRPVYGSIAAPTGLTEALHAWLEGDRRAPLTFDLRGVTPFFRQALLKAREIPHGEVRPYSWIAREIGRPGAVRAVGSAMARNPIPLFIPCHRVVRNDGRIGAYGLGGPEAKRRILAAEGAPLSDIEALAAAGVRYIASDTGDAYCYPTCHYAQRITPAHRISFNDEAEAMRAGYHPCAACRPPTTQRAS